MQVTGKDLPGHVVGNAAVEMRFGAHLRQRDDSIRRRAAAGHTLVRLSQLRNQAVLALLVDQRHDTLVDTHLD